MYDGILGGYDPLISPTGRAFMAGEKQGTTPEQMAQSGAISFADAIALKQMAERARASAQTMQAQQMPQPQPTVVDELRSQVAGSAAMPFREGGLAGLPVQNIGTQAMASGGIVAFQNRGLVESDYASDLDYLQSLKQQARARGDLAAVEQINTAISAALSAGRARRTQEVIDPIRQSYGAGIKDIQEATRGTPTTPTSAPPAAPATAPQPAGGISAESLAGSPFDIAGNLMPQPSSFGGAQGMQKFSAPTGIAQLTPEETVNQRIQNEISGTIGEASRISAPRLNAGKLYPEVEVSQEEQDKIRGELRNEGEASGLPGLLRRGAERTGQELKDTEKNKRTDTWLLLAQAGFGIAGSTDPFGAALGKAGQQFAGQYAALNKEVKAEMRALNKDQEAYNKSLAEFELNQNAESRRRVDDKRNRMQVRQDKIADVAVKQADLDFRAAMANQDAETKRRGMRVQQLLSQIRSTEKVTLSSAYTAAVLRGDVAEQDRLIAAMERASKASSAYLTQGLRNEQNAMGPGMGGFDLSAIDAELARR